MGHGNPSSHFHNSALYKISEHFRFALRSGFDQGDHSHLILLEDDLIVGSDFLQLFEATAWLLDANRDTLWCVSAWNDNGLRKTTTSSGFYTLGSSGLRGSSSTIKDSKYRLLRTGYFPGLGWMTTSRMWKEELSKIWPSKPSTGWDHYIRQQTKTSDKRECIYPEIPRTKHISKHGSNVNTAEQVQRFALYNFIDDLHSSTSSHSWFQSVTLGIFDRTESEESNSKRNNNEMKKDITNLKNNPFGDTSYLLYSRYKVAMKAVLSSSIVLNSLNGLISGPPSTSYVSSFIYYYKREEFSTLSTKIGLPRTQERGWHLGVLQTRIPGTPSLLYLINRRYNGPYISKEKLLTLSRNVEIISANQGKSCNHACNAINKKCSINSFEFLNKCHQLKNIFKCEHGCGHQIGSEIPCYVNDILQPTHQQCLVTDGEGTITCESSHKSTKRLCGCI